MLYQLKSHEYKCPACTMNYGVEADNAEEAALAIYTTCLDPKGSHFNKLRWDARTLTLNTGLREYLVVDAPLQEAEFTADLEDVMEEFSETSEINIPEETYTFSEYSTLYE